MPQRQSVMAIIDVLCCVRGHNGCQIIAFKKQQGCICEPGRVVFHVISIREEGSLFDRLTKSSHSDLQFDVYVKISIMLRKSQARERSLAFYTHCIKMGTIIGQFSSYFTKSIKYIFINLAHRIIWKWFEEYSFPM